jgi:predicted ferric reductase
MKRALTPKHPLQWAIIICVFGCAVILGLGQNWSFLGRSEVKQWTGAALLMTMAYQSLLLWKKLVGSQISRLDQDRHRFASYVSIFLILTHLSAAVATWYSFLLFSFVLAAITAYFARVMMKPKSREAVIRQVFLHTLFGAVAFAAALPHAVMALAFE